MERAYEGQQFNQPIAVTDLLNGRSVTTMQPPFPLTEADFERLKGSPPITATLATIVFSSVVAYAVTLGPKLVPIIEGGQSQLTSNEIRTMLAGTALSASLYAIGFLWPNKKKRTMKKIEKHFESNPPSLHILGGGE